MILGYKCSYCSTFNLEPSKIVEHEANCVFNPSKKHCYTCNNRVEALYHEEGDTCKEQLPTWDCEGNCPKWVLEEET